MQIETNVFYAILSHCFVSDIYQIPGNPAAVRKPANTPQSAPKETANTQVRENETVTDIQTTTTSW